MTLEEQRNKIFEKIETIKTFNLVNYIIKGVVTKEEVLSHLTGKDDIIEDLENQLAVYDDEEWQNAQGVKTAEAYNAYLHSYPEGRHVQECQIALNNLDEETWFSLQSNISEEALLQYKRAFPSGKHSFECDDWLQDIPWVKAKGSGTIASYEEYLANPGKHSAEAQRAIAELNDDNDWFIAEAANNRAAYQQYIEKHPTGKHVQKAQNALNASAGREKIIESVRKDRNAFSPEDFKKMVGNKIIEWGDIEGEGLFTHDERVAIEGFVSPKELPYETPPEHLVAGLTEVYFWGTPDSGKTCALGAILSAAKNYGILKEVATEETGSGTKYMKQLSNIFVSDGICVFPHGTPPTSIQQMAIGLRAKKRRIHKMNLIDLAGELFKSLFYMLNDPQTYSTFGAPKKDALERTLSYLCDEKTKNDKIHFFIVAYGEERKTWEDVDLYMSDFLNTTVAYLNEKKIMQKNTVGVYVLVTKSDLMPCPVEERKSYAEKYVKEKMPDFYNNIVDICDNAGVTDLEIIPFSIGSVFAKKLGRFERENTDVVLNKLILKTYPEKSGFWGWLERILNQ